MTLNEYLTDHYFKFTELFKAEGGYKSRAEVFVRGDNHAISIARYDVLRTPSELGLTSFNIDQLSFKKLVELPVRRVQLNSLSETCGFLQLDPAVDIPDLG